MADRRERTPNEITSSFTAEGIEWLLQTAHERGESNKQLYDRFMSYNVDNLPTDFPVNGITEEVRLRTSGRVVLNPHNRSEDELYKKFQQTCSIMRSEYETKLRAFQDKRKDIANKLDVVQKQLGGSPNPGIIPKLEQIKSLCVAELEKADSQNWEPVEKKYPTLGRATRESVKARELTMFGLSLDEFGSGIDDLFHEVVNMGVES